MANATVSNLGQFDGSGSTTAGFLKVWSGEVLAAFYASNVMFNGRHVIRSISSGKSASFPATWQTSAAYHTPGTELVGTVINANERVISIDSMLVADSFVAEIDEAQNHYDVRSIYTTAMGESLANTADKQLLQLGVLAARASATVSGGNGGSVLTNANYGTIATTLAAGIFAGAQKFDEKNVAAAGRFCVLRPAQYYLLGQETDLINTQWGGQGSYADGSVRYIAGVELVKSNNLPITDLSGGSSTGQNNTYLLNAATTVGVMLNPQAVGTVKLKDLSMRADYDPRRLGTLMVAKYAMGHGILRPECAIEFKTA